MKKTVGKWLILLILLSYTAIAGIWADQKADSIKCTGFTPVIHSSAPASFVTTEGIFSQLDDLVLNYGNYSISEINTDSLERYFSSINNFEKVECVKMNDGKIYLNIVPMIPEIRIFSDTLSYYINKDGKQIDAIAEYFVDVPVVKGKFNDSFRAADILPVTRQISKDSLMKNLITMIVADSKNNIILVPRIKGHVINIGDTCDLPSKFRNIKLMYEKVIPYKGWEAYDTISVKFKNQIVASRKDKSKRHHNNVIDNNSIDYDEISLQAQTLIVTGDETESDNTTLQQ